MLEFYNNLWGARNRVGICRTGPPGYIGWQNRFLGIDFWAPYKFKNTTSASMSKFRPASIQYEQKGSIFGLLILKNSKMADLCYSGKIEWPRHVDPVAKDLIKKLLVQVVFYSFFFKLKSD